MSNRKERLDVIRKIITDHDLCSQEELLQALSSEGYNLTQATLSRDLKHMKVAKTANHYGKYVYTLPAEHPHKESTHRRQQPQQPFIGGAFISLQFSGNIAVVKTSPGFASSMAYHIDNHDNRDILGTIAGDDTIMLVLREGVEQQAISDYLTGLFTPIK